MLGLSASGIGGASTVIGSSPVLFESSGMMVGSGGMIGAASCARTNVAWESTTPMTHTTIRRMRLPLRSDDALCRRLALTSK